MQCTTWIEADVPRVACATHGVKQLRVPWAEPGSQFTALFERLAIDLLRECSITGAVRLLRISGDEGWGIKARAVKRGLARRGHDVVARLGVDEKAIAKRHPYLTIVADEGITAVIQWVKKTARGFRNAEHFKTAISFHCGGLDLYPHEIR